MEASSALLETGAERQGGTRGPVAAVTAAAAAAAAAASAATTTATATVWAAEGSSDRHAGG